MLPTLALLSAVAVGVIAAPAPSPAVTTTLTFPAPAPSSTSPVSSQHCYLYVTAKEGDSCVSIAATFNINVTAFRRMNPGVDCEHLVGNYCVADGTAGGGGRGPSPPPKPSTTITPTVPAPTSVPSPPPPPPPSSTPRPPPPPPKPTGPTIPTPHQDPITSSCRSWHLVSKGDTCELITKALGISQDDFRKWNGFLNDDCTNLWLDYYCCIGV